MNDAGVAKRYAQALFMLAEETSSVDEIGKDLDLVCDTIEGNEDLKKVYTGVQFANSAKKEAFTKIFDGKVDQKVINFSLLLVEKMRTQYLADIQTAYHQLLDEKHNIADATVYTAFPLSEGHESQIAESLGSATGKNIRLKVVEDPSLLAGIRIQFGDRIIDGSAKARLESMRERLKDI